MRLEDVRVMRVNDIGSLDVSNSLHPRVGIEHADRIIDASNARQDVLVEIFLEVNGVTGQHHRASLGKSHDQDLAAGGVRYRSMDVDTVVAEQVQIAIEFDGLIFAGHAAADTIPQHGKIVGDEESSISGSGPESVPDLIALVYKGRVEEFADVAGVIDVEMSEHDVLYIGGLDVDLAQLGIYGDIWRTTRIKRLNERPPIVRIGDDLVVVAAVEQHIPFGMPDQEKADRNLNLAAGAVLNNRFVEIQRA